jgi:ribosome-associated translation inhibitor RaiA
MTNKVMEKVNHPLYYGGDKPYEAIKVIEAWKLGFHLGNVVKYISRWNKKGDPIENLEKAVWYLQRKIDKLKERKARREDNQSKRNNTKARAT